MRSMYVFLLVLGLSACLPTSRSGSEFPSGDNRAADLPDLGLAPEFTNDIWLNTDHPLRLADLRGKVVLVDMWTFG